MKFILFKNRLQKALIAVSRITSKNFSLPVLEYVLIEAKDRKIRFSTTNLEIALHASVQGKIEKEGSILVPAQLLNQIVSGLDAEKVELEVKDGGLSVLTETYTGFVKGISPDDFPVIPEVSKEAVLPLPVEAFRAGLAQLNNVIVISEARPEISGALMQFKGTSITMVGTDSFRLGEKKVQLQKAVDKASEGHSLILPLKAVQELIRLTEVTTKTIDLYIEQSQVLFDLGDIQLISRLIEGTYPAYEKVIPSDFSLEVTIPKADAIEKVKLASLFSPKTNDVRLRVDSKAQELILEAGSSAMGETTVKIPVKAKGDDVDAVFNFRFLLDGLTNIEGETALFRFETKLKKLLMRSKTAKDFVYVVMPIKE